jgi:sporulation protein YlmC with PRC-barrel domain
MMKTVTLATAIGALMLTGAVAQTPNPSSSTTTPPPAAQGAGQANFVTSQSRDQWLASKFKGTDVVGTDNSKIGDVSDVLFDKNGKVEAYVISIGGFLGVGSKEVALAPNSFTVVPGTRGGADQLKLSMTKDELKQAQNFTPYSPPAPTTGMGSGSSPLGGAGGMRPSTNTPPKRN